MTISLLLRPNVETHDAANRLGAGAHRRPATRVGYFVYPLGLAAWLLLCRWPELPGDLSVDPEPQHRPLAVHR